MSSAWNHSICDDCWKRQCGPDGYIEPFRIKNAREMACCFCRQRHKSGIQLRMNPADMECNGIHEEPGVSVQ